MSNEQKLLHVALEAINALMMGAERDSDNDWGRICMPTNSAMSKGADAAMAIRQALATTEPTSKQSLQVEPAVNQQLTTEPFDERGARATLPTQRSSMDGLPKPFGYVSDGFADGLRFQHNPWPVEHTLLHSTMPVFSAAAVQQFKQDAERYRWLADSNNYYEAINLISDGSLTEDALGKAIDAAMAKGVKG